MGDDDAWYAWLVLEMGIYVCANRLAAIVLDLYRSIPPCRGIVHYASGWSRGDRRSLMRTHDPAYECRKVSNAKDLCAKGLAFPNISAKPKKTKLSGPPLLLLKNRKWPYNEPLKILAFWRFAFGWRFLKGFGILGLLSEWWWKIWVLMLLGCILSCLSNNWLSILWANGIVAWKYLSIYFL